MEFRTEEIVEVQCEEELRTEDMEIRQTNEIEEVACEEELRTEDVEITQTNEIEEVECEEEEEAQHGVQNRRAGGWRAMPYIMGTEVLQRLAIFGLWDNLAWYMIDRRNMDLSFVLSILNIWGFATGWFPLLTAFIADAYVGRFKTILVGLITSFVFESTTERGVRDISRFFNWYYVSFSLISLVINTGIAYILSVKPTIGLTMLTALMLCAIVLFMIGGGVYVMKRPEGSMYAKIVQVFVACYKKRKVELPDDRHAYFDPPSHLRKVSLTSRFRFLNKAAIIQERDLNSDGSCKNHWKLSTVRAVEDAKFLIRVAPIFLPGMISQSVIRLQQSILLSQVQLMDHKIGNFTIPPSSVGVVSSLTTTIWILFYNQILVPKLEKLTKHKDGIPLLQRIGIGIIVCSLSSILAGVVEKERRSMAKHPNGPPMSVFCLVPQMIILGVGEAFCNVGLIQFYNTTLPEHMGSVAGALFPLAIAGSGQFNFLVLKLFRWYTEKKFHINWLDNINAGKLEYFLYIVAIIGVANTVYHVFVARCYRSEEEIILVEQNNVEPSPTGTGTL